MHREEKDKTDNFQSINEESMMQPRVIADMCMDVWKMHVNA